MDKTRVDDMLIEMISPKIKEIEEKFSHGQGLNQEDINTLLLKSQYNHINHLDNKLNEVTADVASLKGDFSDLKGNFSGLERKFDLLNEKIEHTIQKALNKNMMLLITVMGFFVIASKLIDKINF
jgi:predicted nuclease with TOPRIM domain